MTREIFSLRELEKAMIEIPLPFPASLIAAFGLTYSETGNSIWGERRNSRYSGNYSANRTDAVSQSKKYCRRMNSGARN